MNPLEAQRLANIREKERLLAELNVTLGPSPIEAKTTKSKSGQAVKKRKVSDTPVATRASARIRDGASQPQYKDVKLPARPKNKPKSKKTKQISPRAKVSVPVVQDIRSPSTMPENIDEIRNGWTNWKAVAPSPTRAEDGTFHFKDFPTFQPNKSPEEMIREGCFGGNFWRPLKSKRLGIVIKDDWTELPPKWIAGIPISKFLTSATYNPEINKYGVVSGQTIEEWEAAGWIDTNFDIRGWFQWYCRFFQGRRCVDDARQVSRWSKCVGPTGRWKRMLLKAYIRQGVRDVFDVSSFSNTHSSLTVFRTAKMKNQMTFPP